MVYFVWTGLVGEQVWTGQTDFRAGRHRRRKHGTRIGGSGCFSGNPIVGRGVRRQFNEPITSRKQPQARVRAEETLNGVLEAIAAVSRRSRDDLQSFRRLPMIVRHSGARHCNCQRAGGFEIPQRQERAIRVL